VRLVVLRPSGGQLKLSPLQVDLHPAHVANLVSPLSGQHEQAHDAAVVTVGTCGVPNPAKLVLGKGPVAGAQHPCPLEPQGRVSVGFAYRYGPAISDGVLGAVSPLAFHLE
jgi:hypothetical protein